MDCRIGHEALNIGAALYTGTGVSLARFHGFSRFISYSGVRPTFARHTKKSHKTGLYGQKL